jgi:hypothetical protein
MVILGVIVIVAGCVGLFMGLERASLRRLERRREAWRAGGCVGPEPERSTLKVQEHGPPTWETYPWGKTPWGGSGCGGGELTQRGQPKVSPRWISV